MDGLSGAKHPIRVRLVNDPGRVGVTTGRQKSRGNLILWQVQFPDFVQYVPEDQLELLPPSREDPLDLLSEGRFGRAIDLRRTLTHVRLSGRLVNLLYSMETTNTDFYAYQFKPVIKILNSPTKGILIADEVGLGKTIEAGLIWTELRSRFDYRRLFVLCPAFLRVKWKRELAKRFGIESEIRDAAGTLDLLKTAATSGSSFQYAVITSMQGLRPVKGWDQIDASERRPQIRLAKFLKDREYEFPLVDLLVIDEAHYLRNPDPKKRKKTSVLGQLLRNVADNIILLSATPIHLRNQDLYELLNIVDEATFNQPRVFDEILRANAPLVRARDAILSRQLTPEQFTEMLTEAQTHPILSESLQLRALIDNPPTTNQLSEISSRSQIAYRLETINLFGHVINRTRRRDVVERRVIRTAIPEKVPLSVAERAFYDKVTQTIGELCRRHSRHEGFLVITPQRQMSSSMPAALRDWKRRGGGTAEGLDEDLGYGLYNGRQPEPGFVVRELLEKAELFADLDELWKNDSKYQLFSRLVGDYLREHPKGKIVVFSYFRPTLDYLYERLREEGISSIVLKGGIELDKDSVVEEFADPNGPNVLLSSEVGSEGIDLQFASIVVNYDLPWNPMRIEQRIGRIDRIGQLSPQIWIWNLFYDNTIDSRIYTRLFERLRIFESSLGGLEPILGEEIQHLTIDLLRGDLTSEQEEARIEQTAIALENQRQQEEKLEQEAAHLVAYGDYILNQVKAARELNRWITGDDIKSYIIEFFNNYYTGCEFVQHSPDELLLNVTLTNNAKIDLQTYMKEKAISQFTMLIRNDPRPVLCRFENKLVAGSRSEGELINQLHPLVRFANNRIDQQAEFYHPVVAVRLNRGFLSSAFEPGTYVFTVQKWTSQGIQDLERLYYAAARTGRETVSLKPDDAELLVTAATHHGYDWPEARNVLDLSQVDRVTTDECLVKSDVEYNRFRQDLEYQNLDRVNVQLKTLEIHRANQVRILQEVIAKHQVAQRSSLVKATDQKLKLLLSGIERKKLKLEQRKHLNSSKQEVCLGVINVV